MKINLLLLSTVSLLLTACSIKNIQKENDTNTTNTQETNLTTTTHLRHNTEEAPIISSSDAPTPNTMLAPTIETNQEVEGGLTGEFANNPLLSYFIERMHTEHGFDYDYLYKLFSDAHNSDYVDIPCDTNSDSSKNCNVTLKPKGKWDRYKGMFIYERNINRGVAFWNEHEQTLNRAYKEYGVLPEYIIGILGIETAYGVNFGKKRVIDVLTTKAMLGDRREAFYTDQLEKFLLMARQSNLDAATLMGSSAGAMGYGQFIPSSYLTFAVDFNGDGVTDLWNAEDAIGSVANYFSQNGWNRNISQVAVRAKYKGNRFKRLKTGYKTKYSQYKLRKKYGIKARKKLHYKGPVSLIKLPKHGYDELWFGTHNFRVITTYNHSTFYGMAVVVLGNKVKNRRYGK